MTRSPRSRAAASMLVAGLCVLILAPAARGLPSVTAPGSATHQATAPPSGTASSERPAIGAGALAVRIEAITPSIPRAGDSLLLSGTIANQSEQPVTAVRAVLRMSPVPLPSRGEIPEILAGGGERLGMPVAGEGASSEVAASLAPGDASPFSVSVPVDDLPLAAAGAYMVGVEALGDSGAGVQRQDLDRTFMPWWPEDAPARPLLITLLWPLTGAPLRDAKGVLLDELPAVELSPAGRLDVLRQAAEEYEGVASLVVDPQVLQAADDLADGYLVQTGDETTTGTRSREVGRWLDAMRQLAGDQAHDLNAMLYAQPDVLAARHGRALGGLLRQRPLADALTADALDRRLASDVVLVPGGLADERTLRTLANSDAGVTVLSDAAMPVTTPSFFTPSGNVVWDSGEARMPILLTDSGLADTLRMPLTSSTEQVAARQRLLAETLTTVLQLTDGQRLLVAAPDPDWSPPISGARMVLDTISEAPWITPTPLNQAAAREPSTVARQLAPYPPEAQAQEISSASVAAARSATAELTSYSGALTDSTDLAAVTRTAPARTLSGWFRGRQGEQDRLIDTVSRQTQEALESVRIVSNGAITVSGSSGTIPVTVENLGPAPVTVGLTLTGNPARLFTAEPVEPFRIEPGRRTSVEVPAQVNAAGPIPVTIEATTVKGAPFGVPGRLTVSSSAYANAARLLVQASLALLLITVVVHGVRRARRRPGSRPANQPAPVVPEAHDDSESDAPARDVEVPRG